MPARPANFRRGTTLLEGLIASVLLATSVVGISGALTASYQNQQASQARNAAILNGRATLESVSTLPLDPNGVSSASIADYQTSTAGSSGGGSSAGGGSLLNTILAPLGIQIQLASGNGGSGGSSSSSSASPPAGVAGSTATVAVDRRSALNGPASASGDFATVSVAVPTTGSQSVTLRRVISRAESAANQAP